MKQVYIILASQEYDKANHQGLWKEMAHCTCDEVVVVNIPADYVISTLKGKGDRIIDAQKAFRRITDNLFVMRPLLYIRPEVAPQFAYRIIASQFWACVENVIPDVMARQVNVLVYNAHWIRLLKGTHKHLKIGYFLFDEVRLDGEKVNKKRAKEDDFACSNSDIIFTMTQVLADSRSEYGKETLVIGNGATASNVDNPCHISRSVAFIGNFRNWIDESLLQRLIQSMPDVLFAFVGPIEKDMSSFFESLLNGNSNTLYLGCLPKESISSVYKMFDGVIVPYKQNDFTRATRPIKIVESVMAGTPVVTIPMDGYQESEFIRFATDIESFVKQITEILDNPIDINSDSYQHFVEENSWQRKALMIYNSFVK